MTKKVQSFLETAAHCGFYQMLNLLGTIFSGGLKILERGLVCTYTSIFKM